MAALFGEHAQEIPFVIKHIAPRYYRANQGFQILTGQGSLNTNADGYDEISKILIKIAIARLTVISNNDDIFNPTYTTNSIQDSSEFSIDNVKLIPGTFLAKGGAVLNGISYDLHSKKGTFDNSVEAKREDIFSLPCQQPESELQDGIEQLKKLPILIFCFGMFFVGTVIEIIAFFIESKESKKAAN